MTIIELIRQGDKRKVIEAMIKPQRHYSPAGTVVGERAELNFEEAIVYLHPDTTFMSPAIKVEKFLDTMLEFDDFTLKVNEIIYGDEWETNDIFELYELVQNKHKVELDTDGNLCVSGYTYNEENDLTRDIVYDTFKYDGDFYVLIRIHYGADARIGFGAIVCFKIYDIDYFFKFSIDVYDPFTDEDYNVWELDTIATYDKETDTWYHKESGNELRLYTPADGF